MEKEDIKNSMKAALDFKEHDSVLRTFAHQEFYKKYPNYNAGAAVWFNGYEVLDENTIEVKYQYGGGDMEMDGSFKVKIG